MTLEKVLDICNNYIKNPEDKEIAESYSSMLQTLSIRAYLTMQEKVVVIVRMLIDSDKDFDVPETFFTAGMEIACCFDGLLAYTNIQTNINIEMKNYENYDAIYQSGLADYILQYCEKDYDRLVRMMERTLSYQNLMELIQSIREVDVGSLSEVTATIRNLKNEIDQETVKNLADIMRINDPALNNLKDLIDKDSIDDAFENKEKIK